MKTAFNVNDLEKIRKAFQASKAQQGWTMGTMAQTLGMSQPAFSQYMSGRSKLNLPFVLGLAEALNMQPYELVDGLNLKFVN